MSTSHASLNELWQKQSLSWEYGAAASPDIEEVPIRAFPASLHEAGVTEIIKLDLSDVIGTSTPATTPSLLANYLAIQAEDQIRVEEQTSSEVYFVMRGQGHTETEQGVLDWKQGDAFTLPCHQGVTHFAEVDSALYWVHDGPLMSYLGVHPDKPRFEPAYYSKEYLDGEISKIREAGIRENRNRNGIILGNPASEKTKTMTHTMWSLFNVLPKQSVQKPHRHNSVAIDLAVSAGPNTYTMIAKEVDEAGNLIDPFRAEWKPNSVFVTPPGWWHSHHNESEVDAYVFPVQDAGLQTYLRTLDIQFIKD
ncbi:hypothetical protein [Rubinisphaera sp.]|uniref:hypothetical protein n=1 Tax=Rubinisphaera sp. TaxID=2024857 RepID=UPI000C0EA64E|nr:hypothetical protein [Rubinisphaera sp.]MBV11899.1 hypothetical protein [Rubinisphaera sp.]HCS55313.1 hypothetical protein [Planctomycetaceae bacterium]|tara:strand:+ start:16420 stop:17343 length:924 start_codon:yes stop_codon:yes gene_type:complete